MGSAQTTRNQNPDATSLRSEKLEETIKNVDKTEDITRILLSKQIKLIEDNNKLQEKLMDKLINHSAASEERLLKLNLQFLHQNQKNLEEIRRLQLSLSRLEKENIQLRFELANFKLILGEDGHELTNGEVYRRKVKDTEKKFDKIEVGILKRGENKIEDL